MVLLPFLPLVTLQTKVLICKPPALTLGCVGYFTACHDHVSPGWTVVTVCRGEKRVFSGSRTLRFSGWTCQPVWNDISCPQVVVTQRNTVNGQSLSKLRGTFTNDQSLLVLTSGYVTIFYRNQLFCHTGPRLGTGTATARFTVSLKGGVQFCLAVRQCPAVL